jgi:hypothetical protein
MNLKSKGKRFLQYSCVNSVDLLPLYQTAQDVQVTDSSLSKGGEA